MRTDKPVASAYMALVGEERPVALASGGTSGTTVAAAHVYEYTWTLGLTGDMGWMNQLTESDSALVQIIVSPGWSPYLPHEVFATLEYLPPSKNVKDASSFFRLAKQLLPAAGTVAEAFIPGPKWAGTAGSSLADMIPQNETTKWYLSRFDLPGEGPPGNANPFGVEWHLSRNLVYEFGSRLVGRLGILYLDAPMQPHVLAAPVEQDRAAVGRARETAICLQGRFGIKKGNAADLEPYSMLPRNDTEELMLKIQPTSVPAAK